MFAGPDGGVLRSGNFRRRQFASAVAACQAADLTFPAMTPHDLRHTAASLAVSAGANVKALRRMLGHVSAAMTLDVYADLFDDDLDAIAIALDDGATAADVGKAWANSPLSGTNSAQKRRKPPETAGISRWLRRASIP